MALKLFPTVWLVAVLIVVVHAQQQAKPNKGEDKRSFVTGFSFTTFTLIKTTTTTTSTFTSTTTCTTSTDTLTTCSAGRRRRGLFYDEDSNRRARRGLFFNEEAEENSALLVSSPEKKSNDPVDEVVTKTTDNADPIVPLELQTGFSLPDGVDSSRFLLAFGTATRTSIVITTTTSTLTAICSSTTGFLTCSSG